MLELRPTCEQCNEELPPESTKARICSFECTFCCQCAGGILAGVCPNCGGGFAPRPIRPSRNWKGGNSTVEHPPMTKVTYAPIDPAEHEEFAREIKKLWPELR